MPVAPATVLTATHDAELRSAIRRELAHCGFASQVAANSQQARQFLHDRPFDLLIADADMLACDGSDLLVWARRCAPDCKVILFGDTSNKAPIAQALTLGAYDYLEKPLRMGELLEVVYGATCDARDLPHLPFRAAAALQQRIQAGQATLGSVRALIRTVEAKDPYTRRHSEHVMRYAVKLAALVRLDAEDAESIRIASLLHDIGKIGVPDRILTKCGPLTEEEFACVRRHPAIGADILADITLFAREARIVRHHHERWDGKGYPDGLAGEEIPPGSRIILVADSMDAMLMDRSYRARYPAEKMLDELARQAGTQFNPTIAMAAVRWYRGHPDDLVLPGTSRAAMPPGAGPAGQQAADDSPPSQQRPAGDNRTDAALCVRGPATGD